MIDIQFIRDNPDSVAKSATHKGYDVDVYELLRIDESRRQIIAQVEELRQQRNELSKNLQGQRPTEHAIATSKKIKEELLKKEEELAKVEASFFGSLSTVPNVVLDEVPVGTSEKDNIVSRTVGEKPAFDFALRSHAELAELHDWIDKERASKIAGSRFAYIKGDLARLEFALWQYGIEILSDEKILQKIATTNNLDVSTKPFTFVLPPAVARTEVFEATGRLNREEQTYKLEGEDLWLNASAEHTLAPMYYDEVLNEKDLPIRMVGYTTAFRREAGTYGKDTEGIFRLHQFNKLEMESFTTAADSYNEHLFLIAIQEYLMQQLGLTYQVIEKCTADVGFPNAKGVDINGWMPHQGQYRETHTADYITDFQTRSMQTKVRFEDGQIGLAHTNDATAFSERPLIAILENYQQKDGSVLIPQVLRRYMNNKEKLT